MNKSIEINIQSPCVLWNKYEKTVMQLERYPLRLENPTQKSFRFSQKLLCKQPQNIYCIISVPAFVTSSHIKQTKQWCFAFVRTVHLWPRKQITLTLCLDYIAKLIKDFTPHHSSHWPFGNMLWYRSYGWSTHKPRSNQTAKFLQIMLEDSLTWCLCWVSWDSDENDIITSG